MEAAIKDGSLGVHVHSILRLGCKAACTREKLQYDEVQRSIENKIPTLAVSMFCSHAKRRL